MREQVKSALRYPSFVVAAMAVAIVIINLFVIPAFAKVYKGFNAKLPLMTRDSDRLLEFHGRRGGRDAAGRRSSAWFGFRALDAHARGQATRGTESSCAFRSPARSSSRPRWRALRAASRWRMPQRRAGGAGADAWSRRRSTTLSSPQRIEKMRDGVERGESHAAHGGRRGRIHAGGAADDRGGRGVGRARRHDGGGRRHVPARGRVRAEDAVARRSSRS